MRIILCDDDPKAVERYERLLSELCEKNGIDALITVFKGGDQILFNIDDVVKDADIVFMDVTMPGINGIETARKLRDGGYESELIFLTSSTDAVFYAFDVRATNYLVKDVATNERIEDVLLDAAARVRDKKEEYILLTGIGEHRNVALSDIRYFEIMQKIVTVYYGDNSFEFISTMGKLENLLFNKGFVRIGRSFLVSTRHIQSISYEKVVMSRGEVLPVGRKYYKALKDAMKVG